MQRFDWNYDDRNLGVVTKNRYVFVDRGHYPAGCMRAQIDARSEAGTRCHQISVPRPGMEGVGSLGVSRERGRWP